MRKLNNADINFNEILNTEDELMMPIERDRTLSSRTLNKCETFTTYL